VSLRPPTTYIALHSMPYHTPYTTTDWNIKTRIKTATKISKQKPRQGWQEISANAHETCESV